MNSALLIGTDTEEQDYLQYALVHHGLKVSAFQDYTEALTILTERPFDVIVVSTDDTDVFELIDHIRAITQTISILLVSDPLTETQHVRYLDAGVGCVLQHPLSMRLFTRYTSIMLRRASSVPSALLNTRTTKSLELNPTNRTVSVDNGNHKRLTPLEFRLLYVLMNNSGQLIPTEQLVERVWGYNGAGNRDLVRGLVKRLRRKLGTSEEKNRFIHNLPGEGYRFEEASIH